MDYDFDKEVIQTDEKCPNGCDQLLVMWTEANGEDDYKRVWYCKACGDTTEE